MKKNTLKGTKKYSHLSLEEREEIAIGLENGMKENVKRLKEEAERHNYLKSRSSTCYLKSEV
jgi:hypothetical protein